MNILIVDDLPINRKLLLAQLKGEGFGVFGAADGAEALGILERENIDAVISDILMPNMDGYRLCFEVRKDERWRNVPFIVYSATYTTPEDEKLSLDLGADSFLKKPSSPKEIVDCLQRAIRATGRQPKRIEPPEELSVTKEYNEWLVRKLEQRTQELAAANQELGDEISEVTRARMQIQEQAALLDEARDAICVNDLDQNILFWNKSAERLYGWTPNEALGRNANELLCQGSVALTALKTLIQGGEWRGELPQTTRQGRQLVVESRWTLIREESGTPKSILVINTDITEAKHAAEQVREQAALLDHAQDAILVQDLEGRITYWNQSAERVFGWTAEEALGRNVQSLLYESFEPYHTSRKAALSAGEWIGEATKLTKAGGNVLVESRLTLVRDDAAQARAILVINTDITEKRALEGQVFRAQRMESIGTLAGGIAHDLNNVLTPIIMAIDLLKCSLTDPRDLDLLETMGTSGRRGAEMVKQVLLFARGSEGERGLLSSGDVVRELERITRETFPKSIAIEAAAPPGTWNISGDRTQLHQVMLNLCVNARDAMPRGGRLRISVRNHSIDEHFAAMHPGAQPGPYVMLEVAVTGEGMTPKTLAQIFEPFFTTKEIGKGTGLGLSTTHAIVKSHGGFMTVESEPGKGTTFQVHLPAETGPAEVQSETLAQKLPRGDGEIILIIDDEASIRSITGQTLEAFGYRVMSAGDGAEGVTKYAQHAGEIAVVLTDMMMPVMDGAATIAVLRRLNPEVRIIAVSGQTLNSQTDAVLTDGSPHFLLKPYTGGALLRMLASVLGKKISH